MTLSESPAALEVEAFCTGTAFEGAGAAWRTLWSAGRPRTPFLSPEWHAAWWRHLPDGTPEVVLVRRGGRPIALAPLVRTGDRLAFAGGDLADVLDVIAADDAAARALASAVAARADRLELRWIPEGGRTLGAFAEQLREDGFALDVEPLVVSPRVGLRASFDEQLGGLSKKDRHELRRKMRRLESVGAVTFAYARAEELDAGLDRFVRMHRATPGEKGRFLSPAREAFFREVARVGVENGWLRLGELRLDGRPIASLFAVELDGTLAAYNSSVDPDAAALSPGLLLHAYAMRDAIERGIRVYDFLRGDERYKYDLGGTNVQLYRVAGSRAE